MPTSDPQQQTLWEHHHAQWRDPQQIISLWQSATDLDPALLDYQIEGDWWGVLGALDITLLLTREYEHLVIALGIHKDEPRISYASLPHPSGIAVDRQREEIHIASTRNPNQIICFRTVQGHLPRLDVPLDDLPFDERLLLPVASTFYGGALYIHELQFVGGVLHANSVGQNSIIRPRSGGQIEYVWHPRCIEQDGQPVRGQNHIQLNSIAAGDSIEKSFFSASSIAIEDLRPGDPAYPVDGRGVIFSGETREPILSGLTRPHSARLHRGDLWVANSGYGGLVRAEGERALTVMEFSGWTRGLCFYENFAFIGTSRVIPRFRQYAPGLQVERSLCGVHAVNLDTMQKVASLTWEAGNQIFDIVWLPRAMSAGFPTQAGSHRDLEREKRFFYAVDFNFQEKDSQSL